MKKNADQFPTCDGCGREIRGESTQVKLRSGGVQNFHPDAHACASAPTKPEGKRG
jgi:hypothetical protein